MSEEKQPQNKDPEIERLTTLTAGLQGDITKLEINNSDGKNTPEITNKKNHLNVALTRLETIKNPKPEGKKKGGDHDTSTKTSDSSTSVIVHAAVAKKITPVSAAPAVKTFGQVYFVPTLKPEKDISRESYRERLQSILKKVKDLQPEKYDEDAVKANIGSFTMLPTYEQNGWIGGHSLDEIKEALEKRRRELEGNPAEYKKTEPKYNRISLEIDKLEKEVVNREDTLKINANNWKQDRIDNFLEETNKIKNVLSNNKALKAEYFDALESNYGLITKTKEALASLDEDSDSIETIRLKGQLNNYFAEIRLIEQGLDTIINKLSSDLSNGPQDETFSKNGKTLDVSAVRNILELTATQKTREALGKRNIGNEIRRRNEIINDLSEQVRSLRNELAEHRGAISKETQNALRRVLLSLYESEEVPSKEILADAKFLMNFTILNEKEVTKLEKLFGPDISQDDLNHILRGPTQLARLPGGTPLSVEHIAMLGKNPIADLMNGIKTHGKNMAVYEAWKKVWLDSDKINAYRSKNKTKGLWESDEKEAQQISTTKEMFNLEFELLKLEDFTTNPHLADNFGQNLIIYAKILSGVTKRKVGNREEEEEDIKYLIENYNRDAELKRIEERKAQLEEARKNKELEDSKNKDANSEVNKTIEFLSRNNSWEKELIDIKTPVIAKRAETEKATLNLFVSSMEAEISAILKSGGNNIPGMDSIIAKIEEQRVPFERAQIMRDLAEKWTYYYDLFATLSAEDLDKLDRDKSETIKTFKESEKDVPNIIFGLLDYGTRLCNEFGDKARAAKSKMEEEIAHKTAMENLPRPVLKSIADSGEDITEATLVARGINKSDAKKIVATLTKAGILK